VKSIVVAYEDKYCNELHLLVKALRRDAGAPAMILEPRSVRGTGRFANEVPRILRDRLKQTKLPPDRVVCLGDADRPQNLVPDAEPAPQGDAQAVENWVLALEQSWRAILISEAHISDTDSERLRVVCLRWSKESLLVACTDALRAYALERERRDALDAVLNTCEPCPTKLDDAEFSQRYRKPGRCLDDVFGAIDNRRYKKGRDDEDLLRDQIRPSQERREEVLRRCPDLRRLLAALA